MSEDLPLEYGFALVVGLGTEHLEGEEFVLVIGPAAPDLYMVSTLKRMEELEPRLKTEIDSRSGQVLNEPDRRVDAVSNLIQDFVFVRIHVPDVNRVKPAGTVCVSALLDVTGAENCLGRPISVWG